MLRSRILLPSLHSIFYCKNATIKNYRNASHASKFTSTFTFDGSIFWHGSQTLRMEHVVVSGGIRSTEPGQIRWCWSHPILSGTCRPSNLLPLTTLPTELTLWEYKLKEAGESKVCALFFSSNMSRAFIYFTHRQLTWSSKGPRLDTTGNWACSAGNPIEALAVHTTFGINLFSH